MPGTLDGLVALYAAAVATVLAAIRIVEFLQARERVNFSVVDSVLISGDPSQQRMHLLTIRVGNCASFPIHLTSIGFTLHDGSGILFIQVRGLPMLPATIDPTEGFMLGILPDKLGETLGKRGSAKIRTVVANDGSGRSYERKITKHERAQIDKAIGKP